jgi:hypothetical protein
MNWITSAEGHCSQPPDSFRVPDRRPNDTADKNQLCPEHFYQICGIKVWVTYGCNFIVTLGMELFQANA